MDKKRLVCQRLLLALALSWMSSCHITWGGRGTLNCVIDHSLDRPVVGVSELPSGS